jgi:hypothetical protein
MAGQWPIWIADKTQHMETSRKPTATVSGPTGLFGPAAFPPDLDGEVAEELREWPGDRSGGPCAAPHRSQSQLHLAHRRRSPSQILHCPPSAADCRSLDASFLFSPCEA